MRARVLTANVPTKSGRIYTKEVLLKAINENAIKAAIKSKGLFGELKHPSGDHWEVIELTNAAILINQIHFVKDDLLVEYEILDTGSGKDLKQLKENGAKIKLDLRGVGNIVYEDNIAYVEDLKIITFDVIV